MKAQGHETNREAEYATADVRRRSTSVAQPKAEEQSSVLANAFMGDAGPCNPRATPPVEILQCPRAARTSPGKSCVSHVTHGGGVAAHLEQNSFLQSGGYECTLMLGSLGSASHSSDRAKSVRFWNSIFSKTRFPVPPRTVDPAHRRS